ncbi:MAG: RNase P subunit p30 family protein [Candidatus Micrarchaeota archaeon]|nr:RNase P subunit p30 family protein [Candidatus Micrarchaeota archaeon]
MKNFVDLNLSNAALRQKSLSLGYSEAKTMAIATLPSKSNVKADVVESTNVELLISACKRHNSQFTFINPLLYNDFYKGTALLEIAREKEKVFEIPLRFLLRSPNRSKLIFQLRIFLKNCLKRKIQFVFTSRALTEFDLKSPREIIAIGETLGLNYEQSSAALSYGRGEK